MGKGGSKGGPIDSSVRIGPTADGRCVIDGLTFRTVQFDRVGTHFVLQADGQDIL